MRLIDADEIRLSDDLPYKASVKRVLMQAKEIEAAPVVHAKWVKTRTDNSLDGNYFCSACISGVDIATGEKTPIDRGIKYCPNCGAKMDQEGWG